MSVYDDLGIEFVDLKLSLSVYCMAVKIPTTKAFNFKFGTQTH